MDNTHDIEERSLVSLGATYSPHIWKPGWVSTDRVNYLLGVSFEADSENSRIQETIVLLKEKLELKFDSPYDVEDFSFGASARVNFEPYEGKVTTEKDTIKERISYLAREIESDVREKEFQEKKDRVRKYLKKQGIGSYDLEKILKDIKEDEELYEGEYY